MHQTHSTPLINQLLKDSAVHEEWRAPLSQALQAVSTEYLASLVRDPLWLPGMNQLLRAFRRDLSGCRYILFGESPYPRMQSANGIAFYDGAVNELWSEQGLSKAVNRATSLRNIMKTALLAEQLLQPDAHGKLSQSAIASLSKQGLVQTIHELFDTLQQRGFLLFNATPVLHPERKPALEARFWTGFVDSLLTRIAERKKELPTLLLWGKVAQQINAMPSAQPYPKLISEHPYNLSFIQNPAIRALFSQLKILQLNNTGHMDFPAGP
jgi:uracil-DNA glycosylase